MKGFFEASSVAVIGVSASPTNLGRAIVYNLTEFRFPGVVYPVGPKGGAFMGHKIYTSVLDIPDPIDLAVILTPAFTIPEVLKECGEKGIRRAVIESSGFSEYADERKSLENEVLEIAEHYGIRFIGPNGIGLINLENGLSVPFMPFEFEYPLGKVAILAQSGGIGACMLNALAFENIGFSKFVSMGNKLNINENDLLDFLKDDESTETIFIYLEGIADGRKLMKLASECGKPVIIYKSNYCEASSRIARSHSASLSSDKKTVDAAFKQVGIVKAENINESVELIKAFQLSPMRGRRLAIISRSGGHAVVAADAASHYGFDLVEFPESIIRLVEERSRAGVIKPQNPLDLGDLFDLDLYEIIIDMTLERKDVDGACFIHNYQGPFEAEKSRQLASKIAPLMSKHDKAVAFCLFTSNREMKINRQLCGVPIFNDPWEAIRALDTLYEFENREVQSFVADFKSGMATPRVAELIEDHLPGKKGVQLPVDLSYRLLACYGIKVVPWLVGEKEEEILAAADEFGYPVVLKTANPEIIHKSDEGGVVLNIENRSSLLEVLTGIQARLGKKVLLQKQVSAGVEVFVGMNRDDNFGPVIMFGLGGIFVELFEDLSRRIAPLSPGVALQMINETKAAKVLGGYRTGEEADVEACADLMVRLSYLACDLNMIAEVDLNPVIIATGHQKGATVVDCRMVWGEVS